MKCRPLDQLVDLCLLRWVELHCRQVLPYGIRQCIKDYLIVALDNTSIRTALKLWVMDKRKAAHRYGHISLWDTHLVTNMGNLFRDQYCFNDDISGWDRLT
jgi:hypothetical protein